ncbi:MAG: PIG-L family deacetylase [Vallitaleaceae bacterium]|nr:PIG-L family deacetylase [Vallitaleaceae bacterium]
MILNKPNAELFIPSNMEPDKAMERTTHMAIAAHQDDIEIMAYDGILKCFGKEDEWFFGAVVTNGSGSPRDGLYASYTDEQMQKIRKLEQKKAAFVGEYGGLALLDYTSSEVKDAKSEILVDELVKLISISKPKVIYTHNLADKHDTHVAVAIRVILALRKMPAELRPEKVYGCEVWRSLDWVNDEEKISFDVSAHPNLANALVEVFDSQICGGKRYDNATTGRRLANATYAASHGVDSAQALSYAMDLTDIMNDETINIAEFIKGYINRFEKDILNRVNRFI